MTLTFMPPDYEVLESKRNYWKLQDFKIGETRFRVVCNPIAGNLEWFDKKPYRYRPAETPKQTKDPSTVFRKFWTFYVWDYERNDFFILEILQASVIQKLINLGNDPDWGNFCNYDIKIKKWITEKKFAGKNVPAYEVIPTSPKPLAEEIASRLAECPVRLEALYEGKDPWKDLDPSATVSKDELDDLFPDNTCKKLSEGQCAVLDSYFMEDMKALEMVKERFRISDAYDLSPSDFDHVVEILKKRKESRNGKTKVA